MMDEVFYIPRKYLKIPQFSLGLYDSVLGLNRNLAKGEKGIGPDSKRMEDLYEIVVRDSRQILILPSAIQYSTEQQPGI